MPSVGELPAYFEELVISDVPVVTRVVVGLAGAGVVNWFGAMIFIEV